MPAATDESLCLSPGSRREATHGSPPGRRYLELVYESRFENADMVTETLVMTLDDDGA